MEKKRKPRSYTAGLFDMDERLSKLACNMRHFVWLCKREFQILTDFDRRGASAAT